MLGQFVTDNFTFLESVQIKFIIFMPEKLLTFLENGSLMKVGISEEYQSFVAMASRSVKIDCPYCTVCCICMTL